jgi:hypothetical protein
MAGPVDDGPALVGAAVDEAADGDDVDDAGADVVPGRAQRRCWCTPR